MFVYSICSRPSIKRIQNFHHQVSKVKESTISEFFNLPYVLVVLVGNTCNQVSEREESFQEGYYFARELGCGFVETSAKNGVNFEKTFFHVVCMPRRRRR